MCHSAPIALYNQSYKHWWIFIILYKNNHYHTNVYKALQTFIMCYNAHVALNYVSYKHSCFLYNALNK